MRWNNHYRLKDKHCLFSPSRVSWLNYTEDKLVETFRNEEAKKRGTRLHALAAEHIDLGIKMARSQSTLNRYVNDAIQFKMKPEIILYYSDNFFGTADAIQFYEKQGLLRVHDLKTGQTPGHIEQTFIYAALFLLEYGDRLNIRPGDIDILCRIYQFDDFTEATPDVDTISHIMDQIIIFDDLLQREKSNDEGFIF